jgi:hypothetical protein
MGEAIPDAAIEAAAREAFYLRWGALYTWERVPPAEADSYRTHARAAIAAAMPAIREHIAQEIEADNYVSTARDAIDIVRGGAE